MDGETVWLNQAQMAELFGTKRQAITKHLQNIYDCAELKRDTTSSILELVRKEGIRTVKRKIEYYNLDAIISVGFRVNTKKGIEFRIWANQVLKDYLLKGYVVNQRISTLEHQVADLTDKVDFFVRSSLPQSTLASSRNNSNSTYNATTNSIRLSLSMSVNTTTIVS